VARITVAQWLACARPGIGCGDTHVSERHPHTCGALKVMSPETNEKRTAGS